MQTPASLAIAAIHGPSSFSSSSSPGAFSSERGKVDLNSEQQPPSASTPLAKNEVGILNTVYRPTYVVNVEYMYVIHVYMYIRNRLPSLLPLSSGVLDQHFQLFST